MLESSSTKSCLSMHKDRTDKIDLDEVANSFLDVTERRRNYFGHVFVSCYLYSIKTVAMYLKLNSVVPCPHC